MSDIDKLLASFESGALLRPSARALNIVDLARAVARLVGVEEPAPTSGADAVAALIGPAEHLVLVVADGLGMNLLEGLPAGSPLVAGLRAELQTIFPTSTAPVLTTLATGQWPNHHAVTGQWTHLPELAGTCAPLPFTARSGGKSLARHGLTVEQVFPLPPLLRASPRDVLAILPEPLANSRASVYFSGGRPRCGYRTLPQAIDLVVERIAAASGPTYTYLYIPWIDLEAHHLGTDHPGVAAAVAGLEHELVRLAERLGGRARLVLTADHGLLDAPTLARHWLKPSPELFDDLLFPPSGDARVMYLHARDDAHDRLRRRFRERFGDRFYLLTIEEAEALELFGPGPLAPATRERLGSLLLLSAGADVIDYVPNGRNDRVMGIVAQHSGLSPAEMRVPLVVL